MTAEPLDRTPRMKLERAIEFSEPITGLAVNTAAENDPLIRVALRTRAQVVVHASTGESSVLHFMRRALTRNIDKAPRGRKLRVFGADRMLYRPPAHALSAKAPSKRLVASFNPWWHQSSEQVWAGLAQAVAAAAEPAIMPDRNAKERYWFARNAHKVDRRHLQRQLWKRIYSPLLSFADLGFGLSLLAQLIKLNVPWAWATTAALTTLGVLHTGKRYFWGPGVSVPAG